MTHSTPSTSNSTQLKFEAHREKATDRQIRAISYHLWQAKYNDNVHYVNNIMTKHEASDILTQLMKGNDDVGIKQLEHFANSYK